MNRSILVLTALVAVLPLSACSSQVSVCTGDVCNYRISGKPTLDVQLAGKTQRLQVVAIEPGAVTLSTGSEQASIDSGTVGNLGGLAVRVVSADGEDAELEVRPTPAR